MADFSKLIPIIEPLIKAREGGLSKDKDDTASKNPVPDGSGNHTNKGVTWTTFTSPAVYKKVGYVPSIKLFYEMPYKIWIGIFKYMYWDSVAGDQLTSAAVAFYLADWAWGSGNWAVKNLQQVLNRAPYNNGLTVDGNIGPKTIAAANKIPGKTLLELLKAERIDFYEQIAKNDPKQVKFLNGWKQRATDFFDFSIKNMPEITAAVASAGGFLFFLTIVIALYFLFKKKQTQPKLKA